MDNMDRIEDKQNATPMESSGFHGIRTWTRYWTHPVGGISSDEKFIVIRTNNACAN